MLSQFLAASASVALIGAGVAGSSAIRSFDALPSAQAAFADGDGAGASNRCRVDVIRAGSAGSASVARQVLSDGGCVCIITTGPASDNGSAEDVVTALLRDRTCPDAPVVGRAVREVARTGGGSGAIIPVLVGVVGAAGLLVALGGASNG